MATAPASTIANAPRFRDSRQGMKELAVRAAQDFDAFYRERPSTPEVTDDLLVLSFDGKGIAMRLEDLRAATRKAAAATPRRLPTRLTQGEKPNRKRMAEVATVYTRAPWPREIGDVLHGLGQRDDAARPRPTNKRVWASIEHNAQRVIDDAFDEALRRDPARHRRWVVLIDGQLDQRRRIERAAAKRGVLLTIVLDIVHVLEYLWRAAHAFHPGAHAAAEQWVDGRLLALLNGRSGGEVAKSLRLMLTRHDLEAAAAKAVEKTANYLVKNTRLLHYDRALKDGLPIATGVIKGACRYLVLVAHRRRGHPAAARVANERRLRRLLGVSPREGARAYPPVTLRGRRRAEPASARAPAPAAGQVIGNAPVERCSERAAPWDGPPRGRCVS